MRWLLLAAVLASGCSTALLEPVDSKDSEIEEMKSRILELQRQARMSDIEVDRLRRQVASLEARVRELGGVETAPTDREPVRPVLDDEVEPARPAVSPIEEADIPPPAPDPPSIASPAVSTGAGTAGALPPEAQELYDQGYTYYHQGRHLDAESSFRQFLNAYPSTELADNANYWIGEARFARGDYSGALSAFQETVERYPSGNKRPDALLKVGDCLTRLGDTEAARQTYSEVMEQFPDSAAAISAEERRADLR